MPVFKIVLAGVAVFLLLAFLLTPSLNVGGSTAARAKAKNDVIMLTTAARAHTTEFGAPPQGDAKTTLRILQGDNPRKVVFLEISPKQMANGGRFTDPWGSPYVFDLSASNPWAYSFGRNRQDEGGNGDDVASWK